MSERLWEYRGYWIRSLGNSPKLYACWYDDRRRREARRTLGTEILDEAKDRLVELIGSAKVDGSRSPDRIMIIAALDHYYENDVKAKPSADQAHRAIKIINDFLISRLGPVVPVSAFGPLRQREFMKYCHDQYKHGPSTIARNLSVVSSAFRFAQRLKVVKDGLGNEHEVQLLDSAPEVVTQATRVAQLLNVPEPKAREWTPTLEQFGKFIDAIDKRQENLFRYVIIALNTWARPDAIIGLRISSQVDRDHGLIDLNPDGRRQNKKHRPRIPLTRNLAEWLDKWGQDAPMDWDGQGIGVIKKTFKRHALKCDLPKFTQGTIRHFMATKVKASRRPFVSQEQRDAWLGHDAKRTANFYEAFDPDFLKECRVATENVIAELQKCTKRELFARKLRATNQKPRTHREKREAQHVGK